LGLALLVTSLSFKEVIADVLKVKPPEKPKKRERSKKPT
jgi:hypothetical protein